MQGDNFNKTPHILLLFWRQFFTKIFTGKMILPMVLPVNQWYGKFSKFSSLRVFPVNHGDETENQQSQRTLIHVDTQVHYIGVNC